MVTRLFSASLHALRHWLFQRLSGVLIGAYAVLWMVLAAIFPLSTWSVWPMLFANIWIQLATALFLPSVLYHAWLGVRDISMDYLPRGLVRWIFQKVVATLLIGYGVWGGYVLWSVR